MRIEEDMFFDKVITDDIKIVNNSTFDMHGIVNGNISVESGCTFLLHGILNGDLIVSKDAIALIYGTMNGTIMDTVAKVELHGILNTKAEVPEVVIKMPNCYINNQRY